MSKSKRRAFGKGKKKKKREGNPIPAAPARTVAPHVPQSPLFPPSLLQGPSPSLPPLQANTLPSPHPRRRIPCHPSATSTPLRLSSDADSRSRPSATPRRRGSPASPPDLVGAGGAPSSPRPLQRRWQGSWIWMTRTCMSSHYSPAEEVCHPRLPRLEGSGSSPLGLQRMQTTLEALDGVVVAVVGNAASKGSFRTGLCLSYRNCILPQPAKNLN